MLSWLTQWLAAGPRRLASPRRQFLRLKVEALEDRCVPSTVTRTSSTNWSGYAVATTPGAVSAVSGSWVVPAVTGTSAARPTYSSAWVGIDGFNSSTVEQVGTEMDFANGKASYSAWFETFPNAAQTITSITVKPGDTVSASVRYNAAAGTFTLTISDGSQSFTTIQAAPNARLSSAEWIAEAPSSGSVLPLANFGAIAFTNAQATIDGAAGAINNTAPAWQSVGASVYAINMANGGSGAVEASTSSLTASGAGFSVAFSAPTPPPDPTPPAPTPAPAAPVATTTTLTAGAVTARGRHATTTLTVTIASASGAGVPTGLVALIYDGVVLGFARIQIVNGVAEATFQVSLFQAGSFDLTAAYLGNPDFQESTSNPVTVTV